MLGGSLWHRGHSPSSNSREARRARAKKKTAPKGGLGPGKGAGLEVNTTARIDEVEAVDILGNASQLAEARAVKIVVRRAADAIPRDQIDVGIEVLIRQVKMEGSGLKALVEGEEPAIDFRACYFNRGIDVDEGAGYQDAV